MPDKIRILLVDDQRLMREGLRTLLELEPDLQVAGEAGDGQAALDACAALSPDVVLMDIRMPGMDGVEATRRLRHLCPDCLILALTVHDDKQYFMQMLAEGASGYITKQAAADDLVAAIHTIAAAATYPVTLRRTFNRRLRTIELSIQWNGTVTPHGFTLSGGAYIERPTSAPIFSGLFPVLDTKNI